MDTTTTNDTKWTNAEDNNHQEPFLVSALFGHQTVVVDNVDHDVESADDQNDEFGDMVRSWLVTVACCFVFGLILLAAFGAAAARGTAHGKVEIGMGGHQHSRGKILAPAAPFFQKQDHDWTMSSMSTSGGFSAAQSSPVRMPASQPFSNGLGPLVH